MTPIAIVFLLVASVALLTVPRRWAAMPLLAGACFMTLGQAIQIGPFTFPVVRLLILVGFLRVALRGEWKGNKIIALDTLMLIWATWFATASAFHEEPRAMLVTYLGLIYNALGTYVLIRCFCRTLEDFRYLIKILMIVMVPVALEMVAEQITRHNFFSVLGGVSEEPSIRGGRLRSQGPFRHAILAGTAGAVCLPLIMSIWRRHRMIALVGILACLLIVATSGSSGPIMSCLIAAAGLMLWRWRHLTRKLCIAAVVGYFALELVMSRPAYFIIAYLDLTGSSTAYHRARIIQAGFEHLDEWWFAGTDYTRHWMPYGVSWSEDHADITNHYLGQGVKGGVPLMCLFIAIVWFGFRNVGQMLRGMETAPSEDQFIVWALGATLFTHAVTCTSIAYFDQSSVFLYLTLAVTASLWANSRTRPVGEHAADGNAVLILPKALSITH